MATQIKGGYRLTENEWREVQRALGEASTFARVTRTFYLDAAKSAKGAARREEKIHATYCQQRTRYFIKLASKLIPKVREAA